MAPKKDTKKRVAAKGYKLPDPIPPGLILCDVLKQKWKLGKSIGQGGFGEIYLASDNINKVAGDNSEYVVKIEPHSNGPLFTEMHCYIRIGKPQCIENWKKEKKLKHLGMPKYLGSGSHEHNGQKYRFLVMERFGEDLQKIINKCSKKFSYKTVFQVVIQILDVLEYIHAQGYIHADIKASNLLIGHRPNTECCLYLVDYGLACKYIYDGKHKEYKFDQRKAHNGTIEFTSRDAHIGAHSRRGDLEILGYNLLQWLSGKLPWEDNLADCNYVASRKRALMDDIPEFMRLCFPDGAPPGIQEYIEYVSSLTFDETPNYEKCRLILREGLRRKGYKDDGKMVFKTATPKAASRSRPSDDRGGKDKRVSKRRSEEAENFDLTPVKKRISSAGRTPFKPKNFCNRLNTRTCPKNNHDSQSCDDGPLPSKGATKSDDFVAEKENLKGGKKKQPQSPYNSALKNDFANPTPQMLDVMLRMMEKNNTVATSSRSKKRKNGGKGSHNNSCISDPAPTNVCSKDGSPPTLAMLDVIRKREQKLAQQHVGSDNGDDYFDESDLSDNSVFYSPVTDEGSSDDRSNFESPSSTLSEGETSLFVHSGSPTDKRRVCVRSYSSRRCKQPFSRAKNIVDVPSPGRSNQKSRAAEEVRPSSSRVATRSNTRKYSPEIL